MSSPKQFSIVSLRAALDQEDSWKADTTKMIERNSKLADKFRPIAFIGVVMLIVGTVAKFGTNFSFLNNSSQESLVAIASNFLFFGGLFTTLFSIVVINILWRVSTKVNRWDRAHWNRTWGVPTVPVIKYQHDKDNPGYLIAVDFNFYGKQFIGHIEPNDPITQNLNFNKPDSQESV